MTERERIDESEWNAEGKAASSTDAAAQASEALEPERRRASSARFDPRAPAEPMQEEQSRTSADTPAEGRATAPAPHEADGARSSPADLIRLVTENAADSADQPLTPRIAFETIPRAVDASPDTAGVFDDSLEAIDLDEPSLSQPTIDPAEHHPALVERQGPSVPEIPVEPEQASTRGHALSTERTSTRRRSSARVDPPRTHSGEALRVRNDDDRYTMLRSIHRGGMGEIWLARMRSHDGFSRKVVLKGLLHRLVDDDVSMQLFSREARVMAALEHPNIIRVFEMPRLGGRPYLAMEYVRGRNLHQIIQRANETATGMPIGLALRVVAEALRGLHSAHHARNEHAAPLGIVHRDVSPGNILVSFFGEVKITDFGIARTVDAPKLTGPRAVRGKARYVAPEQIHGFAATPLSDVYSAGVVLAEAILGHALWERPTIPETLVAIISEDREATIDRVLARKPHVPGLREALSSALAINPKDRFVNALEFAEALETIARDAGEVSTCVDLGHYVRLIFQNAPDLPEDDGFEWTPFSPGEVQATMDTDPTIIALEPDWMRAESDRSTTSTRPRAPSSPLIVRSATPHEPDAHSASSAAFGATKSRDPSPVAAPRRRPSLEPMDPPPVRIRAVALPAHVAVLADQNRREAPFAELRADATDEEPPRALEPHPRANRPRARSGRSPMRRPGIIPMRGEGAAVFLLGIFIGAALAVLGIVLALVVRR